MVGGLGSGCDSTPHRGLKTPFMIVHGYSARTMHQKQAGVTCLERNSISVEGHLTKNEACSSGAPANPKVV